MFKDFQSVNFIIRGKNHQKYAGDLKLLLLQKLYEYQLQSTTEKKNRNMCHSKRNFMNILNMIKIFEYITRTNVFSYKSSIQYFGEDR